MNAHVRQEHRLGQRATPTLSTWSRLVLGWLQWREFWAQSRSLRVWN